MNLDKTQAKEKKCYFCDKPCTDEMYCYGCGSYICDDCADKREAPWGKHSPDDHELVEDNEEEDEGR